jgi:hypothetical protein
MWGAMRGTRATMTAATVLRVNSCGPSLTSRRDPKGLHFTLVGCFLPFFVTQLYFINKRTTLFKYSNVTVVGHHNEGMDGES